MGMSTLTRWSFAPSWTLCGGGWSIKGMAGAECCTWLIPWSACVPWQGAGRVRESCDEVWHESALFFYVQAPKSCGGMWTRIATLLTNRGVPGWGPFSEMPKRVLEGATQEERAKIRRLGTLRQLTVQPTTRKRYDKAVDQFLFFSSLRRHDTSHQQEQAWPPCLWLLRASLGPRVRRGLACDTLAGLQDIQPGLRTHMPAAWRLWRRGKLTRSHRGLHHFQSISSMPCVVGQFLMVGSLLPFLCS